MKNDKILISARLYRICFGLVHPSVYFESPASTQASYNTHWQDRCAYYEESEQGTSKLNKACRAPLQYLVQPLKHLY